jgi:hypothetical protein
MDVSRRFVLKLVPLVAMPWRVLPFKASRCSMSVSLEFGTPGSNIGWSVLLGSDGLAMPLFTPAWQVRHRTVLVSVGWRAIA